MPDIHVLELEFAKNPTLEACIPLCEAYLGAQRFMEAMVVCKKGIKAAPADPRGYVMLARVYADQGKLPKAQQELQQAMTQFPGNPWGLEFQGRLLMLQGNRDGAAQFLQQALMANPQLQNARKWLAELGLQVPAMAAAPAPAMMPRGPMPGMMPQQQMAPTMPAMPTQPPGPARQAMPAQPPGPARQAMPTQPPGPARPAMAPQAMPGMVPGAMPPGMPMPGQMPGIPGMMPGAALGGMPGMQRPGMPAAPPSQPGMRPGAMLPQPPGMPQPSMVPTLATVAPAEKEHHLEHVSDFFAPDSLGFKDAGDTSSIETAGPGRLTIVGFVPKTTGSIKTTIMVALGVFAIAAAVITYVYVSSQNTRRISKLFTEIVEAMDEDKYVDYTNVLKLGEKVFEVDSEHDLTLSALAYVNAILATEHGEEDAMARAKQLLSRAQKASEEPNEWLLTAQALIAYHDGKYEEGLASLKEAMERSPRPLVHLEALRLRMAVDADSKETELQLRKLKSVVSSEARAYNFLGWYAFALEDWAGADKSFTSALQNAKGHPRAFAGSAMVDLDRNIGLKERQKEVEQSIKQVFALPKDELSGPDQAYAHFARSQLAEWRGDAEAALEDYKKATKLLPELALFPFRRGVMLLRNGKTNAAVEELRTAAKLDRKNWRVQRRLVEALLGSKQLADARSVLEGARKDSPDNAQLLLLEGDLLIAERKLDQAIAAFKKIDLTKHGHKPLAWAQIGISRAIREGGDGKKAAKHMEDFLRSAPSQIGGDKEVQAPLWCEMGLAHERSGNKAGAEESYRTGIDQFRYYPDCNFYLCRVLGRGPEAVEACKSYLALDPNGKWAAEAEKRVK